MEPLISIVGPTASGKTALGLELALAIGGEILSVDSMQVYRGMDIGTAKATPQERALVPHHFLDILDPDQIYNAGRFVEAAQICIQEIQARGKVPILLGGTSLYLRSLLFGIIEAPEADPALKQALWQELAQNGVQAMHQKLLAVDPKAAQTLHPNDQSRIIRALEVWFSTGRSILEFREEQALAPRYPCFTLGRDWPREVLYERINQRVVQMIEAGLLKEVQFLLNQGFSPSLPSFNSIGYKQAIAFLQGTLSHEEMVEEIQKQTRRYAKKQLTWMRSWPEIHWLKPEQSLAELLPAIQRFLGAA